MAVKDYSRSEWIAGLQFLEDRYNQEPSNSTIFRRLIALGLEAKQSGLLSDEDAKQFPDLMWDNLQMQYDRVVPTDFNAKLQTKMQEYLESEVGYLQHDPAEIDNAIDLLDTIDLEFKKVGYALDLQVYDSWIKKPLAHILLAYDVKLQLNANDFVPVLKAIRKYVIARVPNKQEINNRIAMLTPMEVSSLSDDAQDKDDKSATNLPEINGKIDRDTANDEITVKSDDQEVDQEEHEKVTDFKPESDKKHLVVSLSAKGNHLVFAEENDK